jgi:hypothetical protein
VRNNYSFHYPTTEEAEAAFQAAAADSEFDNLWRVYISEHGFNSLFFLSDIVFLHGIRAKAKSEDMVAVQKQLMGELSVASVHIVEFAQAFFAAAWRKTFGDEMLAQDIVKIENAPKLDDIALPFFVQVTKDTAAGPKRPLRAEEIAATLGRESVVVAEPEA